MGVLFLILSNIDLLFAEPKLAWRSYISAKTSLITKKVQVIDCKEFVVAVLDLSKEAFVVQIAYLGEKMLIHLAR